MTSKRQSDDFSKQSNQSEKIAEEEKRIELASTKLTLQGDKLKAESKSETLKQKECQEIKSLQAIDRTLGSAELNVKDATSRDRSIEQKILQKKGSSKTRPLSV